MKYLKNVLTIFVLTLLHLVLGSPVALASNMVIDDEQSVSSLYTASDCTGDAACIQEAQNDSKYECKNVSFGFYPSNTNPTSYQPNWTALTHVANLDWTLTNEGTLVDRNADTNRHAEMIFSDARAHGVKTLISCMGTRSNCDSILAYHQDDFVINVAAKINQTNAEGIILDFEYPSSTNSYTGTSNTPLFEELVKKLYSKVKSINPSYTVAFCTPPYFDGVTTAFQNPNLKDHMDFVFIMGYDYHYAGPTGANSPFYNDSTRHGLRYAIAEQAQYFGRDKLVYGVPFYGYEYTATSNQPEAPIISKDGEFFLRDVDKKFQAYEKQWDSDSNTPYICYLKDNGNNSQTILDSCDILGSTTSDYHVGRTVEDGAYKCAATINGSVYMLVRNPSRWNISSANYVNVDVKAPVGKSVVVRLFSNADSDYVNYRVTANGNWQRIAIPFKTLYKYGNFNPASVYDIRVDMSDAAIGDSYYVENITASTGVDTYYQAWYEDNESLALKYQYIKDQELLGVGYWALGYEGNNSSIWNVFARQSDNQLLQLPVASFTATPLSGYTPLNVQFTDSSTRSPTAWKWSFGDGNSSTEQNPTHTYSVAGNYIVNLTVSNVNGTNSTFTNITVLEQTVVPVANFNTNITSGQTPLTVQFTDLSKNATGVSWDFDNNGVIDSTERNPVYTYVSAGNYTVNLTAANINGMNSKFTTINVSVNGSVSPVLPVTNFTSNVIEGYAPLSVQFNDTSTGTSLSWNWSFGDGTTNSVVQNPTHTYSTGGNYTVMLTVSNSAGNNTTIKSSYIKVTANTTSKPVVSFWGSRTSGKAPLTVTFTDASTNTPTAWNWSFGDGTYSTIQKPKHIYSKAGNYSVTLTATNAAGSGTKTRSNYIKVT